jgi:serine protease AprX
MKRLFGKILVIGLIGVTSAQHVNAQIDEALSTALLNDSVVTGLVVFRQQADVNRVPFHASKSEKGRSVFAELHRVAAESRHSSLLASLEARGVEFHSFFIINAIRIPRMDARLAEWLAGQPEVAFLTTDPVVSQKNGAMGVNQTGLIMRTNPEIGWGLEWMGVPEVWALGYSGQGVVIGGQDTGYEWDHPALRDQYRGNKSSGVTHEYNWHDAIHEDIHPDDQINPCGYSLEEPCADNPHGILTMAVAIGAKPDFSIGVAPAATWIGCRNMDRGFGTPSTYLECFEWFLAPTDSHGENPEPDLAPHVINNSWVCPLSEGCTSSHNKILDLAVRHLVAAGVVVVASAGNDGPECGTIEFPPAIFEQSFTVGAFDANGKMADFSSRGPVSADETSRVKPDVVAPGVAVPTCGYSEEIIPASGTSLAAPHVAGMIALMISARPSLAGQVDRLTEMVRKSALPLSSEQDCMGVSGSTIPNAVSGYGMAQAARAVALALEANLPGWQPENIFYITPNPFGERLLVRTRRSGIVRLQLYTLHGQLIQENTWSAIPTSLHSFPTGSLPSGVYVCRLQVNGQSEVHKVVKW